MRILPGFWTFLLVVALALAPLSAVASVGAKAIEEWAVAGLFCISGDPGWFRVTSERYALASGLGHLWRNAGLYILQFGIDHTLMAVTYSRAWNGSLWTLFYEVAAYLAAGLLLTGWVRRHPLLPCLALPLGGALILPWVEVHVSTSIFRRGLELGLFFLAGMVVHALAKRLPVRGSPSVRPRASL